MDNVRKLHMIKNIGLNSRRKTVNVRAVVVSQDPVTMIKDRFGGADKPVTNYTLSDSSGMVKLGVFGERDIKFLKSIIKIGSTYNFFNINIPEKSKHKRVNYGNKSVASLSKHVMKNKELLELYEDISLLKYSEMPNISVNVKAKVFVKEPVRENPGSKVMNMEIVDSNANKMRMIIWNEDIDRFKESKYNDTLELEGVLVDYSKYHKATIITFIKSSKVTSTDEDFAEIFGYADDEGQDEGFDYDE